VPSKKKSAAQPDEKKSSSGKSNQGWAEGSVEAGQQIMAEGNAKLLASLEKKLKEQYKIDDGPYDYGADCIIALTQATKPNPFGPGKLPDNRARAQGVKMFVQVIDGLPADKAKIDVNHRGEIAVLLQEIDGETLGPPSLRKK
jgi:hypothetical protein